MSSIQAVIFDKSYWTTQKAITWLHHHQFRPIKRVHTTENYHRYRIVQPDYNRYNYITKTITPTIKFIIAVDK